MPLEAQSGLKREDPSFPQFNLGNDAGPAIQ